MAIIETLKDFQTVIVGLIGFGGVIWAQRNSAKLSREQHDREIEQKRNALENAILSELEMLREIINGPLEGIAPTGGRHVLVPMTSREVSSHLMGEIGHLNAETINIEKVLRGLLSVDWLNKELALIATNRTETHFAITEEAWNKYGSLVVGALSAIDPAISELKRSRTATLPD